MRYPAADAEPEMMSPKKAFTLIELLVVIAIIALLLAVILPSLKIAKQQAQGTICLSNLRGLSMAWHAYTEQNDEKLVPGNVPNTNPSPNYWVASPQDIHGTFGDDPDPMKVENEIRGIQKGLLFPFIDNTDSYHCPGDKGMIQFGGGYRTYSITGLMNGEQAMVPENVKKYGDIRMPSNKYMFVENTDRRGWNIGSWIMDYTTPGWGDPLAIWHNKRSTLGFADGHAEKHQWVDKTTIEMSEKQQFSQPAPPNSEDLNYMLRGYIPGLLKRK